MLQWPPGFTTSLRSVIQGQFDVTSDPNITMTTVLGSCVSVCLFDPVGGIGGMNHYLLAVQTDSGAKSMKYGTHAMELLINGLLKAGAERSRLEAKIFGGSLVSGRFNHIGPQNSEFAENFLNVEGFSIRAQDTGGTSARRINFHPVTGKVRVIQTRDAPEHQGNSVPPSAPPKVEKKAVILF